MGASGTVVGVGGIVVVVVVVVAMVIAGGIVVTVVVAPGSEVAVPLLHAEAKRARAMAMTVVRMAPRYKTAGFVEPIRATLSS